MINKRRLIIVLAALAAILAVIFATDILPGLLNRTVIKELNFQHGISYRLENLKNDVLFINNEEIKAITNSGDERWSAVTGISNPGVSVSGDYALIFDFNGTGVYLYKNEKQILKHNMPNSILCAKVNKRGYFAVVTEKTGYKGMLTMFSPKGKEIYKWYSGSGYIADIDISAKNNVVVSQVHTEGKEIASKIILFKTKKEKEIVCLENENILFSAVKFNDDESFTALSDTHMFGFSSKGKKKFEVNYDGRSLIYYNIDNIHNLVLAFKGNVNNTVFESYSGSGKLRGTFEAPGQITAADVKGEIILFSVQKNLYSVMPSGKVKYKKEMNNEISSIKIYKGRRKAVLIGGNKALLYDIN